MGSFSKSKTGQGKDNKDTKNDGDANTVNLTELANTVKALTDGLGSLHTTVSNLADGVKSQQTVVQDLVTNFKDGVEGINKMASNRSSDGDDESVNYDEMSNTQLVGALVKQIGTLVDQKLEPVTQKVDSVNTTFSVSRARDEIKELQAKNKDVIDWKDEIISISKNNPNLSMTQAYYLARAGNPDKASQLDEKYKEPDGQGNQGSQSNQGNQDSNEKSKNLFSGLTPTSGSHTEDDTSMSMEEASVASWDEVFGSGNSNPHGDDDLFVLS